MQTPVYPLQSRIGRQAVIDSPSASAILLFTGDTTIASAIITNIASTSGIVVGARVWGPGVANAATVVSKTATSVTLSAAATASGVAQGFSTTGAGLLNGRSVRLYTNAIAPNVNTKLVDFTEATFDGYAAKTLAMTVGYVNASGLPIAQSQLLTWLMTGTTTPNTINGYYVDDGTNVLMAAAFDAPIGMTLANSEIAGVLQDSYPPSVGFAQVSR